MTALKIISLVKKYGGVVLVTAFAVASLIYLTPLKWLNVIEPKMNDIDSTIFHEKFQKDPESYLFIDVRSEDKYAEGHAEGSVNIHLPLFYDAHNTLPKRGKKIVLICGGGRASGVAYMYLQHFGFFNIQRIEGGIEAWQAAGLPVVKGKTSGQ